MTNKKKLMLTAGAALLAHTAALAVPADPTPRQYTQPDGTVITLSLTGDEAFHCYLTTDGMPVLQGDDGFFRYIDENGRLTDKAVGEKAPAIDAEKAFYTLRDNRLATSRIHQSRLQERIDFSNHVQALALGASEFDNTDKHDTRAIPTDGERKVLVILVNFSDVKFMTENPHQAFDDMLNKVGYNYNGATGSAFDFYTASSLGKYKPHFDVIGPVNLPSPMAYYGRNDENGNDQHPGEMVRDAVSLAAPYVNFADYDTNEDGKVDNVYIFYPGLGEASGGARETIWPHAWNLDDAGCPTTLQGVKISRYATSNEIDYRGDLTGIGTFCHEFAHVLGLPDLYDTVYSGNCFTPDEYSAMDRGSYNNNSKTPPTFSAYERYALEWINPTELTGEGFIRLLPSLNNGTVYKIKTSTPTEYWLLENRQQSSWDRYIPGHGLMVWHIDYDKNIWDYNRPNNDGKHQHIDIVEADGDQAVNTRGSDLFPNSKCFDLNGTTEPALKSWAGTTSKVGLYGIREEIDGTITFNVKGGAPMPENKLYAPQAKLEASSENSLTLSWYRVPGATTYYATVLNADESIGTNYSECVVDGFSAKKLGNVDRYTFKGLDPMVGYAVYIWAVNGSKVSPAACVHAVTADSDFDTTSPNIRARHSSPSGTTLIWDAIKGADSYLLTVGKRTAPAEATHVLNFDNSKISSGWVGIGRYDSTKFGQSAPSFVLSSIDDAIETDLFADPIVSAKAWLCNPGNHEVKLNIFGVNENENVAGSAVMTAFPTGAGQVVDLPVPAGSYGIRIFYSTNSTDAKLMVDDLTISLNEKGCTPISGYDERQVNGTEIKLEGLDSDTDYVAYVRAVKGGDAGLASNMAEFTTRITSIDAVGIDENEPMDVYTADGCKVGTSLDGLTPGLYIVRQGDKSFKTIVK